MSRFFDFIRLRQPAAAAVGHLEKVQDEVDRVQRAAATIHDVMRNVVDKITGGHEHHADSRAPRP
jgi:hypothetical protein